MDEYIVPDNEVEIITSDDQVATVEVPAVCYEVPVTFQSSDNIKEEEGQNREPGEYVDGSNEDSVESQGEEAIDNNMSDEKVFNMIPRMILNPLNNKTNYLTQECVYVLVKWVFERRYNPFPTEAQKAQLSAVTKLTVLEIEIWLNAVRKSIVPFMIMKGANFINNYMKYHIEKVKAQGRITVAKFHNKRLLLKKIGGSPVVIRKIENSDTPQKVQYLMPLRVQKVNSQATEKESKDVKINYESSVPQDTKNIKIQLASGPVDNSKGVEAINKDLDWNTARYLMTWLYNYRDNPFPSMDQLRHISDVTGLPGPQVMRWMYSARKKILKKVRQSSTVLHPEDFEDCLTWHMNDLPGPKRMKEQLAAGHIPVLDKERKIKNTFQLSNHKKSPYRMDTSISGDESFNMSDMMDTSHQENKRSHSKRMERNSLSNKRLFIKSEAEELHPTEATVVYPQSVVSNKGASRKGKGNFPLSSKKVLMDWLFKNRHNPYPTDQEKAELSEMSNLTLLQVNNWFINARRRFLDKMLKTGEECFLIKRQHKGFKELSKSYLRESGEVETEIVTYSDGVVMHDEHQPPTEIQITEYVCTDTGDHSMVQYQEDVHYQPEYQDHQVPTNMIEVQVHLLPTKQEQYGSVVRVRCTEDEAVHVLKAVNSHPTVTLNKIPDSSISWIVESVDESSMEEDQLLEVRHEEVTEVEETTEEVIHEPDVSQEETITETIIEQQ